MINAFLIAWPLFSVLLILAMGRDRAKWTALLSAVVQLGVTAYAWSQFVPAGGVQFGTDMEWIPQLGIHFNVGIDGISMLVVLLTNLLTPLIILSSVRKNYERQSLFYSLVLIMQAALVGVFTARDMFLYYIFWELALVPIYLIVLIYGGENRIKITFKFFIYTMFGSLLMLVGILYLYYLTPAPHNFDINTLSNLHPDEHAQGWIFWAFFIAFAIKMPVFPFHTWQPDTYTSSPAQGTMLLSGIMLKMGVYGAIRWMIPIVPIAMDAPWCGTLAVVLAVVGIIYASVIALMQKDFKRMIAYVSMAHVGVIAAGVFTSNIDALQGAVFQMLSHGVTVVGLFFVIDILLDRTKSTQISTLGGIRSVAPQFALYFIIILFGSIALPLTSGFVGEFLLFVGLFKFSV